MGSDAYIIFVIDDQYVGLPVGSVRKIIRAVQTTDLPEAPELVSGIINMGGEMIPVINIRKQFKLPQREISISDRIIIIQTPMNTIAFIVDEIKGVTLFSESEIVPSIEIFPRLEEYVSATAEYKGHTVLIYDTSCLFPKQTIEELTYYLNGAKKSS